LLVAEVAARRIGALTSAARLSFIGSERQKTVYIPLLEEKSPDGASCSRDRRLAGALPIPKGQLAGREFLTDGFSNADGYLVTVLNWSPPPASA
jgi:hypothetical protein